jgi:transposase
MLIAHKIALDLNDKQATYMARAAGCARFAYNWALDQWKKQYDAWKEDNTFPKPNQMALRRQLNSIKRERFPWMREVTKCAPQPPANTTQTHATQTHGFRVVTFFLPFSPSRGDKVSTGEKHDGGDRSAWFDRQGS